MTLFFVFMLENIAYIRSVYGFPMWLDIAL